MYLVTGASGLVGSHLMLRLLTQNKAVKALYRSKTSLENAKKIFSLYNKQALFEQIIWVQGEVNDIISLENAIENVTHVYHCAALVSFKKSDRDKLFKINVEGTKNLVNVCLNAGVKKLCHVSSTAAIGHSTKEEISTENSLWKSDKNTSNYSLSKYFSEMEVWRGMEEGLEVVVVNPSIILGPGDWNQGSSELFLKVWKGLNYYTLGKNAFVDVRDVAKAMDLLMESNISGERFLVISENISYKDLFFMMAKALNKPLPKIEIKTWMLGLAWRLEAIRAFVFQKSPLVTKETAKSSMAFRQYSNQKIKTALAFEFIDVSQSIQETAAIFLKEKAI